MGNVFGVLAGQWTNSRFELGNLVDADTHVIAVGSYRGVHGSTSQTFDARASHVCRLRDGKIDRFQQFADTHMMQRAAACG